MPDSPDPGYIAAIWGGYDLFCLHFNRIFHLCSYVHRCTARYLRAALPELTFAARRSFKLRQHERADNQFVYKTFHKQCNKRKRESPA